MIIGRKNEYEITSDFLRLLYNRSIQYSLNVFVIGKGQVGKSTWIFYVANRIKAIQKGIELKDMTWEEWDYKKYTTTTPQQLVELWDNSENEILAMEEAGDQMNLYDWLGLMNRIFSGLTSTHGMKKNICFIITPYFDDIVKHARGRLDYVVILHHRDDKRRRVTATPRYTRLNWGTFKHDIKPIKDMKMRYSKKFIVKSKEFTEWLKGYKGDIMGGYKEKVGLKKTKYERFCQECHDIGVTPPSISTAKRLGII